MSSRRVAQAGFTMIEMIVTIVLFSAMAAVGSLLISKLAPSYLVGVQAEQALSPREAALWRLSEDFRRALVEGTSQSTIGCTLTLTVASGVNGANSEVVVTETAVYDWTAVDQKLWLSSPWTGGASSLLLDNVTLPSGSSCPFSYISGIGISERARLNVAFKYTAGVNEPVAIPVSATLYSYVNGPYVASIFPATGVSNTTVPVTVSGIFPGVVAANIAFMSGLVPVSWTVTNRAFDQIKADVSSVSPATVDVVVSTVEGRSTLRGQFTIY